MQADATATSTDLEGSAEPSPHATLEVSAAIDALCLLNALSPSPPFADQYPQVRAEWSHRLDEVPKGLETLEPWIGDGAFLIHVYAGYADDLPGLITAVHGPIPDASRIEEPAYRARLDALRSQREPLAHGLQILDEAGFQSWWESEAHESATAAASRLRPSYQAVDESRVASALRPYLGDDAARHGSIYVSHLCRPFAMSLPGGGAVLHDLVDPDELWLLLLHERLHQLDPSPKALEAYDRLGEADPWIGDHQRVLLDRFRESREEEIVIAVELAVAVQLGLLTHQQALRRIATTMGGLPVTAALFDRLRQSPPTSSQGPLDRLVIEVLEGMQPGHCATEFAKLVEPVSGATGMRIAMKDGRPVLAQVFDGTAAAAAGLVVGDTIVSIEGQPPRASLNEVLDQLVGPAGEVVEIMVSRSGTQWKAKLMRSRLPTVPEPQ